MELNWKESTSVNPSKAAVGGSAEYAVHYLEVNEASDKAVQAAIEVCIEKSVSLLSENILDDSQYLLFEWDVVYSVLTIVVTDVTKQNDSSAVVKCCFIKLGAVMSVKGADPEGLWEKKVNDYAAKVQYWIRDYLTTCKGFLNYSLVASFHHESRDKCVLL